MCGIAGVVSTKLAQCDASCAVERMTGAMIHRGPNSDGFWSDGVCSLGHRRLAVIDTSDAGRQPMARDGVQLIYNGELYNFLEKKKYLEGKGVHFHSGSDAEVLLELYLRYGENCLTHLRGMYAFAIWDAKRKKLFCARDPIGIKPFLYALTSEGMVFASELKALLASSLVSKELNRGALQKLLIRGSIPQPETILSEVRHLLPGEALSLTPGESPKIKRFRPLSLNSFDLRKADWPEIVEAGRTVLADALERQLVADVPLGAFLSGGLDSSLLVAMMAQRHGKVRTFSVGFESGLDTQSENELADAAVVARHLGVNHTEVIVSNVEIQKNLRSIAKGLDHPTVDGVNSWFVSRVAAQELTVAISGTGGDELFAGYPWFKAMQDFESVSWKERLARYWRNESFGSHFEKQYYIFDAATASRLCHGRPCPWLHPDPLSGADPLCRVTGMLLSGYTRDQLLSDIDTASMWHSLEVRVPLLDERLLDFALSIPELAKQGTPDSSAPAGSYVSNGAKRLLLELGRPLLPKGFEFRSKRGFTLPFDGWLRGILKDEMSFLLSSETVKKRGWFGFHEVESIFNKFNARTIHWTRPWLLMMVELWAQEVVDQ